MAPWLTGIGVFAIAFITILLIILLPLIRQVVNIVTDSKCPNCKRYWAAKKSHDQLLGFFRKGEERGDPDNPEFRMVRYHKYRVFNRCKYCGFEWTTI